MYDFPDTPSSSDIVLEAVIEGLQDYRMSLINGSRRTLAGN